MLSELAGTELTTWRARKEDGGEQNGTSDRVSASSGGDCTQTVLLGAHLPALNFEHVIVGLVGKADTADKAGMDGMGDMSVEPRRRLRGRGNSRGR
jgi:hypothetical protein